uniref:Uncharacterized protein n=1 Tax=Strix occidentalis caurina TaxID=311401 RepID=A0A8D0EGR6_STROC
MSTREIPPASFPNALQTSLGKEDKTLISATQPGFAGDNWVSGEKASTVSQKEANSKFENTVQVNLENMSQTASGELSTPKPLRKVLLPTPPSTSFQPNFSTSNDSQSLQDMHKVSWSNESKEVMGRDSFSNTMFTSQEKAGGHFEPERGLSSVQYDEQRNPQSHQFVEQTESPSVQSESGPSPQHFEENRAGAPFSLSGPFEERRRDREHGRPWERDRGRNWNRDRDWERHRDKEWDKNRDRNQNKDRDKDSERAKEWERNRDRERARTRDRESYRRRDRERSRSRDRDREREKERDRDRSREKERDRERDRDRERERGKDRKDRSKSREIGKEMKPETPKETQKPIETEASSSTNQS